MKKPANRGGATAGLSNAVLAASKPRYAAEPTPQQVFFLTNRYGLSHATAALIAELAFPERDERRGRA